MGLQKGIENATETICCPHFKKTTLPNVLVSIKLFSLCLAVSRAELEFLKSLWGLGTEEE